MVKEEQIKELAYAIWEQEGRPDGKSEEHYFRAKQILEKRESTGVIEMGPAVPLVELPPLHPTVQSDVVTPRKRSGTSRRKKK